MAVTSVGDLRLFQRAVQLVDAVTAILSRPAFRQDLKLRDQLRDAGDSIVANIAEGFPQPTDRAFARYLYIALGSNAELRARLQLAHRRGYISDVDIATAESIADEIGRMGTALIRHLVTSDRRNRGVGPEIRKGPT